MRRNIIQMLFRERGAARANICTAAWVALLPLVTACGMFGADTSLGFDGDRAMRHAERIVELGPRPVGSEALAKTRGYIRQRLEDAGVEVREQAFTARTPLGAKGMVNVWGVLPGQSQDAIAVSAHYESKLYMSFRFVGANDSASAVGVTLELARVLAVQKQEERPFTMWFLFFDGEEAILRWEEDDSLYGSRHFVNALKKEGRAKTLRAIINLDMIGDAKLDVVREQLSTPWLRDLVRGVADELGYASHFNGPVMPVPDDHKPFRDAGIPALDLIDFTYGSQRSPGPFWHTAKDTLDKLSAKSLQIIGETVLHSLPKIAARLQND